MEEVVLFRYSERETIIFHYRKGSHDYTKQLNSDLQDDHVLSYWVGGSGECGERRGLGTQGKGKKEEEEKKRKLPSLTVRIKETETVENKIPKSLGVLWIYSNFLITSKQGIHHLG